MLDFWTDFKVTVVKSLIRYSMKDKILYHRRVQMCHQISTRMYSNAS